MKGALQVCNEHTGASCKLVTVTPPVYWRGLSTGAACLLERNQLLELGLALEPVEHRVRRQPAPHLDGVLLHRLLERLERERRLLPERVERGDVVVQEHVVG